MEVILARLKFQCKSLDYHFKNVDLLIEALTHRVPQTTQNDVEFTHKISNSKIGNYERLCAIGNPVLKYTAAHHLLIASDINSSAGDLTTRRNSLISITNQQNIGEELLKYVEQEDEYDSCCEYYDEDKYCRGERITVGEWLRELAVKSMEKLQIGNRQVQNVIRTTPETSRNGFEHPYRRFVQSLFGAVFIDAGGMKGNGLEECLKLFQKLWKPYLKQIPKRELTECFPGPVKFVKNFWLKSGVDREFVKIVENSLDLEFKNGDIICEALIHPSFYEPVAEKVRNLTAANYERLEFLGDSVLGVAVAEYFWKEYPKMQDIASRMIRFLGNSHLLDIFNLLELSDYVKIKPGGLSLWTNKANICESIIASIFVDGGGQMVLDFLLGIWQLPKNSVPREPTSLIDLEAKLGYKFKREEHLTTVLSICKLYEESKPNIVKYFKHYLEYGTEIMQIFVIQYFRNTCAESDDDIGNQIKYLSDYSVLHQIALNLNLNEYLILGESHSSSKTPTLGETGMGNILLALLGAIMTDMKENNVSFLFEEVFYRIWNPFLRYYPSVVSVVAMKYVERNPN